jgi:hypothetical protein
MLIAFPYIVFDSTLIYSILLSLISNCSTYIVVCNTVPCFAVYHAQPVANCALIFRINDYELGVGGEKRKVGRGRCGA